MRTCCLCSSLASRIDGEIWNKPLFESANFVAIPSLGSLVEGWMLLVPKKHVLSFGAIPEELESEMAAVKAQIVERLHHFYGDVCAFEHGPSKSDLQVGCGVDHAHLHIVPIKFDLAAFAAPFLPPGAVWAAATLDDCATAFEEGKDYLYLEQPINNGRIVSGGNFGSQVFRKAIASKLGIPERFSWRDFPEIEIVGRTIQMLDSVSQ